MPRWTADQIPWSDFAPALVQPEHLKLVKAAALTEFNAARYTQYLRNVFAGDAEFATTIVEWQAEEEQHGQVLGRYAEMADDSFQFAAAFGKFQDGYVIPVDVSNSIRGSKVGELQARCIVETGTSSFYSALGEATAEPVLKAICKKIAADEYRHYRLFLDALQKYQPVERLTLARRLWVAIERVREADDDELAFAFHCGNEPGQTYDHQRCNRLYGALAFGLYGPHHAERAVAMIFKASGLNPQGWLAARASRWTWRKMRARAAALAA